ncbi:hypothetical protein ATCC90586_000750 [Pythium insidiosum]|nr:hypothetical protein ATCC90586_000750 [Pythium insidiosum]
MQAVRRQLDQLFTAHAVVAIVSGALCFFTPHSHLSPILGDANNTHFAHEFIRLYGALTLAQGWLSLALLRAQLSAPESHSLLHWLNIVVLASLGLAYGYFLAFKTIKAFELPGAGKAGL